MSTPHLLVEQDGHVVTVTMNRPEARNAWSLELMARLWDAWEQIDNDPRYTEFLGGGLNVEKMASVVDKNLYRNRAQ